MKDAISSPQNQHLRVVRSLLQQSKTRLKESAFVAEGARLIEDGLACKQQPKLIVYSQDHSKRVAQLLSEFPENAPIYPVEDRLFNFLTDTEHSQGILAVFSKPSLDFPEQLTFALIPDQIRDPGNLGTILRSAEAAGAEIVLLPPGTTDPWSPKVVRAGMGAHFRLPIVQTNWEEIETITSQTQVYLAEMEGSLTYWQADFRQPTTLLIGGEASGASPEGVALSKTSLRIPMQGQSESLNAAISASILLFEVARQRLEA